MKQLSPITRKAQKGNISLPVPEMDLRMTSALFIRVCKNMSLYRVHNPAGATSSLQKVETSMEFSVNVGLLSNLPYL